MANSTINFHGVEAASIRGITVGQEMHFDPRPYPRTLLVIPTYITTSTGVGYKTLLFNIPANATHQQLNVLFKDGGTVVTSGVKLDIHLIFIPAIASAAWGPT